MNYYKIDNTIVVNTSNCSVNNVDILADNTPNTWQKGRTQQETKANTEQGKLAEIVCQEILKGNTDLVYLSYDSFRADEYKKIAPFDALLYKNTSTSVEQIEESKKQINDCISQNNTRPGHITVELKRKLNQQGIFLIEIKSSKLNKYEREGISKIVTCKYSDVRRIISNISNKSDFIAYPYYFRSSSSTVTFTDYCSLVKEKNQDEYGKISDDNDLKDRIINVEIENASNIYSRVYIDYENNRAFITGYKLFYEFMVNPTIGKMYQEGKSEYAIYYMTPIKGCRPFDSISSDRRLWRE